MKNKKLILGLSIGSIIAMSLSVTSSLLIKDSNNNSNIQTEVITQQKIKIASIKYSDVNYGRKTIHYTTNPKLNTDEVNYSLKYADDSEIEDDIFSVSFMPTENYITITCLNPFLKQVVLSIYAKSNENIKLKTENEGDSIYDVFISHANVDKQSYVDELKKSLDKLNIKIFYDKDTLEWGDNWKDKILEGVDKAEFAIIVISENFFGREWTEKELGEFLNRQNKNGQKIILPIIHNISVKQLKQRYPVIADIQALDSSKYTCETVANFNNNSLLQGFVSNALI